MRRYAFDVLIVAAALESALEVAFHTDAPDAPRSAHWFAVPATTFVALPLLARRRFPFGAPAAVWLIGAGLSFIDGRLVVFTITSSAAGIAAAVLLGNLRTSSSRASGSCSCRCGDGRREQARHAGELVFPVLFGIGWLAGFAVSMRSAADAAEARTQPRERETVARLAVAEERAPSPASCTTGRHAVSVMVFRWAPSATAPETEDREALQDRARHRTAPAEMRRPPARCVATATASSWVRSPGWTISAHCSKRSGGLGCPCSSGSRAKDTTCLGLSTCPLTESCRKG